MEQLEGWPAAVLTTAALLGAVAGTWRLLHLGELLRGTRAFLLDWFGEPDRPGSTGRPSFPERMTVVEERTRTTASSVERLHETSDRNAQALARLDGRVTDHRRRNDEQIQLLREAVARIEARHQGEPP